MWGADMVVYNKIPEVSHENARWELREEMVHSNEPGVMIATLEIPIPYPRESDQPNKHKVISSLRAKSFQRHFDSRIQ